MHSLLGRLKGLLQSLFVLVPLCLDCQSVLASSSRFAGCDPDINEVVRIGLPERYQGELDSEAGFELVGGSCVIFTYGNDYQLLEWFENGKIDASVLTEVSLSLLSNDVAENQYEYTDTWPITNAPLNKNTYALRYSQELDWASDPVTAFGDTLADKSALPVYVPSHLSPGFFYLLQHTKRWFDGETNPLDKDERARFWESFLTRIRFSLDWDINSQSHDDFFEVVLIQSKDVAAKCSDAQYHCFGEYVQQDYFVTRKPRKYARLQGTLTKDISMSDWVSSFDQWLKDLGLNADDDLYVALRDFKDSNYPSQELGSRVRRNFHFTIDELFQFLTDDRAEQSDLGFGLVLAGGGVKAAYQSHLVDHLYSNGYLVNTSPAQTIETDQSRESLTVDYVIGTSGGALLGVFVSSLDGHRTQSLSESIWQLNRGKDGTDQQFIQSSDIFPLVDMLRYLSLLVTGVIFGCAIFFIAKRRERSGARQVQVGGKARNAASK
ncbi:MAG: patatin-like phospholipase family protein, partial [Pseudomonadales bacterium]|nr:patatin-like phospholipase family protein [Pseudomonadales bacterium]